MPGAYSGPQAGALHVTTRVCAHRPSYPSTTCGSSILYCKFATMNSAWHIEPILQLGHAMTASCLIVKNFGCCQAHCTHCQTKLYSLHSFPARRPMPHATLPGIKYQTATVTGNPAVSPALGVSWHPEGQPSAAVQFDAGYPKAGSDGYGRGAQSPAAVQTCAVGVPVHMSEGAAAAASRPSWP